MVFECPVIAWNLPLPRSVLKGHCSHARFVWNLAVEQESLWRPGRRSAPGYLEQCRQLTQARADSRGCVRAVRWCSSRQLRDFTQAMMNLFVGSHRRPTWRKAGRDEGFRIVAVKPAHVRRLSRNTGEVWIPKAGWVRFRWSRAIPKGVKSYRVTADRAGRWHIAFAAVPKTIPAPGTGAAVVASTGVSWSARRCPPGRCSRRPGPVPHGSAGCVVSTAGWREPDAARIAALG